MWRQYTLISTKLKVIDYLPLALLILILLILSYLNYTPGTFLSGWDTLHPEFDFGLNLKRVVFGVWREEQGLGAVAGHSHMADLPRIIFLYLAFFISPFSFLRYFYFFLTLVLGPLGVYFFLERIVFKEKSDLPKKLSSFLGGLFYLLNLGTLQHFYVPFEMFATLYAFLPWLFLFATKFLLEGRRKSLILFALFTFLSTPMAYAAALWYVYLASLAIYALTFCFFNLRTFSGLRRVMVIIGISLIINSYWFLPNIYFLTTLGSNLPQAKINQIFSDEAFLRDTKYATVGNAALLKGFLFDWQKYKEGKFVNLLDGWQNHLRDRVVLVIGWTLFAFVILGILISVVKKEKWGLVILPIFVISFIFLIHGELFFSQLFSLIRKSSPIFSEGFRFPWTKFSIIVMFGFAFYFSQAVFYSLNRLKDKKNISFFLSLILTTLLIVWMLPVFQGELVAPTLRIPIPNEYFQVFSWFNKQPIKERIGVLPVQTFRGWEFYNWGFEGAGFLWFGLKQPILASDFYRWNSQNENYYWEISYALYSSNQELLEKVLEKYQINWLLVDKNVINPSSPKALYFDELEQLLSSSEKISLAQEFGKIKIYKINLEASVKDFVFLAQNLPVTRPIYKWNNYDRVYIENENYFSVPASSFQRLASSTYYPFRSLFTGKRQQDLEFEVEDRGEYFALRRTLPKGLEGYFLEVPELGKEDLLWVDPADLTKVKSLLGEVFFDGRMVEVKIPKVGGYFNPQIDPINDPAVQSAKNCNNKAGGEVKNEIIAEGEKKFLRLTSRDATNCSAAFSLPNLPHKMAYLITAETRNQQGKSLLFWLENPNSRRADIETYLPNSKLKTQNSKLNTSYFIQPPMEKDGMEYTLHFDNISIGREKAVNDLGKITINPIPYDFLTGLVLRNPNAEIDPSKLIEVDVRHPNPSLYSVTIEQSNNEIIDNATLVLSQSYEKGWKAYRIKLKAQSSKLKSILAYSFPFLFGEELKEHVLVNNWANGWIIENSKFEIRNSKLVIIYLPQYLEYLGFFLLLVTSFFLLTKRDFHL